MDDTQTIERGGRRWSVQPAAAEVLLAAGWPPDQPAALSVVKRGQRRTVYRFQAAGRGYYVKVYEAGGLWRRLRARLGLGPGRREWDALLAARAAGLDVPEPVALSLGPDESLVTGEIPDAARLDEYLFDRYFEPRPGDPPYPGARPPELVSVFRRRREPPEGTIDPSALAHRLADLVARLKEADLYLPDLHPGNLLLSGPPGAWRLSLVDLAEAVQPAPPEAVLKHLVQLEHFFEPIAPAAARLRCLERLRELTADVPQASDVCRAAAVYRRRFYLRRDRRTRRESKYFRRIAAPPPAGRRPAAGEGLWRGWATADWADAVETLLARNDADPLAGAALIKDGRTATVLRVTLDGAAAAGSPRRTLIVKRHKRAAARGTVRALLGRSRSMAAMRRGHMLLARGIATARPAAAVDLRRGGAVVDTLLLTEPVEDAQPLSDWLRSGPPAAARRRVTWLLARLVRRMHEAGLAHRDLKAPNILVAPARGPDPRPVLVDLDGLRMVRLVSGRRRVQNLMRLSVSLDEWGVGRRTDRLRFLRTYLAPRGCPTPITIRSRRRGRTDAAGRLRRWWERIARLSARKQEALGRKRTQPPG